MDDDAGSRGPHEYLTAEQVTTRVEAPQAALDGPHDIVLPLGGDTTLGRDPRRCDLAILHASISALHARITRDGERWTIADLGSRNGTWVDGVRVTAAVPIAEGCRIQLGAVELTFSPVPRVAGARRRRRTTLAGELTGPTLGGVVRLAGQSIRLTARELRLVEILAARRRDVADPELAYVPWTEIAAVLGFRSIDADSDNVRELVMRVRRKLRAAGAGDLIDSRRGAGYRLGGDLPQPVGRAA
jgi:DNA-binding response OmpR family regulator